jgi:hypothetical protein
LGYFAPSLKGGGAFRLTGELMNDKAYSIISNKGFQLIFKYFIVRVSFGTGDRCANFYNDNLYHPMKSDDAEITIFKKLKEGKSEVIALTDVSTKCPVLRIEKGYRNIDHFAKVIKWVIEHDEARIKRSERRKV